jgi:hypothetical protein
MRKNWMISVKIAEISARAGSSWKRDLNNRKGSTRIWLKTRLFRVFLA